MGGPRAEGACGNWVPPPLPSRLYHRGLTLGSTDRPRVTGPSELQMQEQAIAFFPSECNSTELVFQSDFAVWQVRRGRGGDIIGVCTLPRSTSHLVCSYSEHV